MPRFTGEIGIGDVLVTREGPWWVSAVIRLGARLSGRPAYCNHAIIVHHTDENGTLWGIEGRPGGVGWRDLSGPLSWKLTNANNHQPKSDDQRYMIAVAAESLLGVGYDWRAIAEHVVMAMKIFRHLPRLLGKEWNQDQVPGHVVCSSFADWAYEQVGLANPGGDENTWLTTPGDWDQFMIDEGWKR